MFMAFDHLYSSHLYFFIRAFEANKDTYGRVLLPPKLTPSYVNQ